MPAASDGLSSSILRRASSTSATMLKTNLPFALSTMSLPDPIPPPIVALRNEQDIGRFKSHSLLFGDPNDDLAVFVKSDGARYVRAKCGVNDGDDQHDARQHPRVNCRSVRFFRGCKRKAEHRRTDSHRHPSAYRSESRPCGSFGYDKLVRQFPVSGKIHLLLRGQRTRTLAEPQPSQPDPPAS